MTEFRLIKLTNASPRTERNREMYTPHGFAVLPFLGETIPITLVAISNPARSEYPSLE